LLITPMLQNTAMRNSHLQRTAKNPMINEFLQAYELARYTSTAFEV
jgi:hypothetical protein